MKNNEQKEPADDFIEDAAKWLLNNGNRYGVIYLKDLIDDFKEEFYGRKKRENDNSR